VTQLACSDGPDGELVLRRRGEVLELVVDGVFAMDSLQTSTERALARLALARLDGARLAVTVAGLGLGYTAIEVLADPRVHRVDVVELHPALVQWARDGLVRPAAQALADPRVRVLVADVRDAVPALAPGSQDALLLDVDNGPDFLVHAGNAPVYEHDFLAVAARALAPGGVLAVWSASPSPVLLHRLQGAVGGCAEVPLTVLRGQRELEYAVYLASARRAGPGWPDGRRGEHR
jgi:spermidine synthase